MKILSHRGWWDYPEARNSLAALETSFLRGFGVETDIRDCNGELVISHDCPLVNSELPKLNELLNLAENYASKKPLTLALNVKSDGLASLLNDSISRINRKNLDFFVFDMSVPDMRAYFSQGFDVFARLSEVEKMPAWLSKCSGIWLDSFEGEWFDLDLITEYLQKDKRVCVVSPELHGRDKSYLWNLLYPLRNNNGLLLCTDFPGEANLFFN